MAERLTSERADPGRDSREELARKVAACEAHPVLQQVLNAVPSAILVINANRQIVAANAASLQFLDAKIESIVAQRPGEAMRCLRASDRPSGCGTGQYCSVCGALQTVLEAQQSREQVIGMSRLLVRTPEGTTPLELRVTATPFRLGHDDLCLVALEDVSLANRVAAMQRLFFHDIANTAGCIHGLARTLTHAGSRDQGLLHELDAATVELIDAIRSYRELVHAEVGDLAVFPRPLRTADVLEELRLRWSRHEVASGRELRVRITWDGTLSSDAGLLNRVLGNMIKNALEATDTGGVVTIESSERDGDVVFSVHNPGTMPQEVQFQIFQRSFSTKGERGRGLGTYSMKLIGERYLGGKVDFASSEPNGTTFRLTLPKTSAEYPRSLPPSEGRPVV